MPARKDGGAGGHPPIETTGETALDYIKLGVHIWVSVLIMGTLWRIVSYHLMASANASLVELGKAMATQY